MKGLFRVLAVDDGFFKPRKKGKAILVGVVSRLDGRVEGILSTSVNVDGLDSTSKIAKMLEKSKFKSQSKFLILDGLNFAGFNLVDLPKLNKVLGIPCIAVQRKKPNFKKIEAALSSFKDKRKRLTLIERAGPIHRARKVFFQAAGGDMKSIKTVLAKTSKHGNLPEPLRLAHLIASGVSRGESTRP
jgi:endonuclease V-like protein UPF0215 family